MGSHAHHSQLSQLIAKEISLVVPDTEQVYRKMVTYVDSFTHMYLVSLLITP